MLTRRTRARSPRALLAAAAAVLAFPVAAHGAQPLSLVDDREPLGPGVELRHQHYLAPTGWVDRHVRVSAAIGDAAAKVDVRPGRPARTRLTR